MVVGQHTAMFKSQAISTQVLLGLLKTRRRIRLFEETAAELFKKGLLQDTTHIECARDATQLHVEFKWQIEKPVTVFC
jgi:hypothetical protein